MPASASRVGVIVLAAGASRRFGGADKLLAEFEGRPLVAHAFALAAASVAAARVAVVATPAVEDLARRAGLTPVRVPPGGLQSDSLKAGIAALPAECDAALVLLGDMPFLTRDLLDALSACEAPACACLGARPMPPALLPRAWFDAVARLEGDQGARRLLDRIPPERRVAATAGELGDVDVAADLVAAPRSPR